MCACATSQLQMDWIILGPGHGPVWMAPAYVTPLRKWLENVVTTRAQTRFSRCVWGDADGFGVVRRFLHSTWLRHKLADEFWAARGSDMLALKAYNAQTDAKKLKAWTSPFWVTSSLSILNYPTSVFEVVSWRVVRVYIADMTGPSKHHPPVWGECL